MLTSAGHLTYCSNIHAGESWEDHFARLKEHIPAIKKQVAPEIPFGIGLRLSNEASLELIKAEQLQGFQSWLKEENCYVFTMNGFPYGGFHNTVVKDHVHSPDWLSPLRVDYTIRLADILVQLLPEGMHGGISTSPLSYRFWHSPSRKTDVFKNSTVNLLQVMDHLIQIQKNTGKLIHIDIEPEPDGMLGNGTEFMDWYMLYLLPLGTMYLQEKLGVNAGASGIIIRDHIRLCYDICHYAVGFEDHLAQVERLKKLRIKTGKIQISAALKGNFPTDQEGRNAVADAFSRFNEPTYLHQVVARQADGSMIRYGDLPEALANAAATPSVEWRAHFHVPIFVDRYELLLSTRQDIVRVLEILREQPFTDQLEIETYTWEVIPAEMRLPLTESIIREVEFVKELLTK
ncbi:MAG TPA: metabolite traffic protein EboE [Flavitalea sp.]|nr:metabolite traffic protein EboE [Flavitalea sp.]